MSDTKILQAILDGQRALKEKLKNDIKNIDRKGDEVKAEVKDTRKSLTTRIDKIGQQIVRLEDDAPTAEEFEDLKHEVTKIQKH